MTPEIIMAAALSGVIVGILLSTFGGGGSVLAAPLLIYFVGVSDPHTAIGTSALSVAVTALISLIGHWRFGRIKWPCALVFGGFGLIGSLIGSTLAKQIDGSTLLIAFAAVMFAIGLSMFRKKGAEGDPDVTLNWQYAIRLIPMGLIVGLAAGFFGIGGGFLIVPGLMLATGMTISAASASSLVSVSIFGIATAGNYALSGWVNWPLAGMLILGGIVGGLFGQGLAKLLSRRMLLARRLFAGMICIVAVYVALQATGVMT